MDIHPAPPSLTTAEDLLNAGAVEEAEAAYRAIMAADVFDLTAYVAASICARRRGDFAASLVYFDIAARHNPGHAGVRMERAADLRALGRFEDAQACYRAVLQTDPAHVAAALGLGECAATRGDHEAAREAFARAVAASPADPAARAALADAQAASGAWEAAEASYTDMLLLAPSDVRAWLGLSRCARQRGQTRISLALCQAAGLAAPASPWPLLESAVDLRALGRQDDAEAASRRALALDPANVPARLGLAHAARLRGDREAAAAHLQAAMRADPADIVPMLELAADLRALNRLDEADAACAQALTAAPHDARAHLSAAQGARLRGDTRAALGHVQAAIRAAPGDPQPWLDRAQDLRSLDRLEEAEVAYRQAMALSPEARLPALLGLAHTARARGDGRAAMAQFEAAIRAAPAEPWPRLELGAHLLGVHEIDLAEACYRGALEMDATLPQARLGLALCARARGEGEAALALLGAAAEDHPGEATIWLEWAAEHREAGDVAAAQDTLNRFLTRCPRHLGAMMSLGVTVRLAGEHEAAHAAFQAAHAAHPGAVEPLVELAAEAGLLGRPSEAAQYLSQARVLGPGHVRVIMALGEQAMMRADPDAALAIYRDGMRARPRQVDFALGAADAHAAKGEIAAALSCLETVERLGGTSPHATARRLVILRLAGAHRAALGLARQATAAMPGHFPLWVERFLCENLCAPDEAVRACLAAMPPRTAHDRAALSRFRGAYAERLWRLDEAAGHYEASAAHNVLDAGIAHDLTRVSILRLDLGAARAHLRRFCERTAHITRLRGRSVSPSQTHHGQIIDEYCLDGDLLTRLVATNAFAPEARLAALRQLARGNPDNTASALSLLLAWRQTGAFARWRAGGAAAPIPRSIAQYWHEPDIPADVTSIMQSWVATNPQWRVRVFNDASAREFLARRYPPMVLAAYGRVAEPAQRADLFRLAWLVAEGGLYADADDRCLQPIETILPAGASLVLYQEEHATLGNNFIAAAPGDAVLKRALVLAVTAIERGDADTIWLATGPGLMTRAFVQIALALGDEDALPPGAAVLDRHILFQAVGIHCTAAYKTAGRHWSNAAFASRRRTLSQAPAQPEGQG